MSLKKKIKSQINDIENARSERPTNFGPKDKRKAIKEKGYFNLQQTSTLSCGLSHSGAQTKNRSVRSVGRNAKKVNRAGSVLSVVSSAKSQCTARSIKKTRRRGTNISCTSQLTSTKSDRGVKMINQYQQNKALGIGSYGKVYSCIDTTTDQTHAVKVIPRNKFKDQSAAN